MPLGIKPTVDYAFKKIFGTRENRTAVIGLLNAILTLPRPVDDVEIVNPFSRKEFLSDKQIVVDIRARDEEGRWLNVEMQVDVRPGLIQRLAYYGCSLYVQQLEAGADYRKLTPAFSICLLRNALFRDGHAAHHRFRLADLEHGRTLSDTIEVHTVELTKYNVDEYRLTHASEIEKWAFFLLHADRYDAGRLRELLPGAPFQQAIADVETIAGRTEDRLMYDQREKALRDHKWAIESARDEARAEGLAEGRAEGRAEGHAEGLAEGVLIGKIQVLQQLLGEPETPATTLDACSIDELRSQVTELQDRLRRRGTLPG